MRKVCKLHNPQQAHKVLAEVLWPYVKAWLVCNQKTLTITVKPETRSLEQNAKLWAMLDDVSRQVQWYGQWLSAEDWKHMFTASLKKQQAVPGIDGGFVVLGQSTSKMTTGEMADLLTLIESFGVQHDVMFTGDANG